MSPAPLGVLLLFGVGDRRHAVPQGATSLRSNMTSCCRWPSVGRTRRPLGGSCCSRALWHAAAARAAAFDRVIRTCEGRRVLRRRRGPRGAAEQALFGVRWVTAGLALVAFVDRARDQAGAHQVALALVGGVSRGKRGRDEARDAGGRRGAGFVATAWTGALAMSRIRRGSDGAVRHGRGGRAERGALDRALLRPSSRVRSQP